MNFLRTFETASLLETKPSLLSYSDGFIPSLPLFSATAGRSGRLTAAGILVAVVGAKAPYYDSRDDNDPPKVVVIVLYPGAGQAKLPPVNSVAAPVPP